ncbi:kinase-like domain-containing protein [Spinellus fusiger]|nr:kinase-like domain-containing protein [Spinellus fusiger]
MDFHELNDESNTHTTARRASVPERRQLCLVNTLRHDHRLPPSLPLPLPLPYLPSDYLPSPSSPKQFVLDPQYTQRRPWKKRQRSQSTSHSPVQEQPRLAIEDSQNNKPYALVPYREWTVILRNDTQGQIVLFNPETRLITLQRYLPETFNLPLAPTSESLSGKCPLCHRVFPRTLTEEENTRPTFMDRNYFRLLGSTAKQTPLADQSEPLSTLPTLTTPLNANAFNHGYYENFFVEVKKLGRGFRGSVYLCSHELDGVTLGHYAVKKVAIGNNHPWLVRMLREVHLLERLHHPNIVSYKHSWLEYSRLTAFGPKVPCLFILMECANGGNLEEYLEPLTEPYNDPPNDTSKTRKQLKRERIRRQQGTSTTHVPQKRLLSMTEVWSLFLDIVEGLAHLHQQNIVHRDLKPPNLLLTWDERSRSLGQAEGEKGVDSRGIPRVLISDFGECEDLEVDQDQDPNRTGATGTLEFMAPEHVRLNALGRNTVEYSSKADMWSLGMVLYYLCYSRLPYSNVEDVDVLKHEILGFKE